MNRCKGLLVGITEHSAHIMIEVRIEVRVTQCYIQRIRVVRNRKELRSRRLCRTSEIEETDIRVVRELIVQHCLRRPVKHLAVIWIMAGGLVPGIRRIGRDSELSPELRLLIAEVEACPLGYRAVVYTVRICRIQNRSNLVIFQR